MWPLGTSFGPLNNLHPLLTHLEILRRQMDHRNSYLEKCSQNTGIEGSSLMLWDTLRSDWLGSRPKSSKLSDFISWALAGWKLLEFHCLTYLIDEYSEPDYQKKTDVFNQELYLLAIYSLLLNTHIHTHAKQSPNILMFSCCLWRHVEMLYMILGIKLFEVFVKNDFLGKVGEDCCQCK